MQWKHAGWALLLIPCIALERAAMSLWNAARALREFVWRRMLACSCVRPGSSCCSKKR